MRIACNACGAEVRHNHKRDPKLPRRVCACGAVGDWTPFPGLPTAAAKVPPSALDQVELDGSDLPEDLRAPFREAQAIFAAKLGAAAVAPGADVAAELRQRQTDHYLLLVENLLRDALHGQARALARADQLHAQLDAAEAQAREVQKLRERLAAAEHDAERANADFLKLQNLHTEERTLREELDRAQREVKARTEDGAAIGKLATALCMGVHEDADAIVERAIEKVQTSGLAATQRDKAQAEADELRGKVDELRAGAEKLLVLLARRLRVCLLSLESEDSGDAQKVLAADIRRELGGHGYVL